MANHLSEIDRCDWKTLLELYTGPTKNYVSFLSIENYIRWIDQDPNIKHIKFFCLNGDFSDGTFVITDRCAGYADTLNENQENLFRLISLLDFSKGYKFLSLRPQIQSTIVNAMECAGSEVEVNCRGLLYRCPKEIALQFEVNPPDGIELRPFTEHSDIEYANSVWPHMEINSLAYFERMAKYNPNIAAYKNDGTMVAWILRLPVGLLGALQTDKGHLHQGYGTLVTKYVSKKIAKMGQDIYAGIIYENYPSRNLFEKLGFERVGDVHWIVGKITWVPADE